MSFTKIQRNPLIKRHNSFGVILSLIPNFFFVLYPDSETRWILNQTVTALKKDLSKSWVFFGGDPCFFKEHVNSISSQTWTMVGSTTCYQPLKTVHCCEKFKWKADWFITSYALKMASKLTAGSFFNGAIPESSANRCKLLNHLCVP